MGVDFNWDFADEPESNLTTSPSRRFSRWRRPLGRGLLALIVLGALALLARSWVQSRLDRLEQVEADLRLTVQLELQAQADGDLELFLALQDPDDPNWRRVQTSFFYANHTPSPGLYPAERPVEIGPVRVEGRQGQVQITHWFTDAPQDGSQPAYPFQTTWFYRLANNGNWQHVAPTNTYLGGSWVWDGVWLDVKNRSIDAELVEPVADNLIPLVTQTCAWIHCAEDVRYRLNFGYTLSPRLLPNQWTLPAPYLIGQPGDSAAETAWRQHLKQSIILALIDANVDRPSVEGRILYPHLVAWLMAKFDLAQPESPDVPLLTQALANDALIPLADLWAFTLDSTPSERIDLIESQAIALIQMIEADYGPTAVGGLISGLAENPDWENVLQYRLGTQPANFYANWTAHLQNLSTTP